MSPFLALFLSAPLVYLSFGLSLLLKIKFTKGKIDKVNSQQQAEKLEKSEPTFARLRASEKNTQEAFLIVAPAVLAAVQAGVPKETISLLSTTWLLVWLMFIFIYPVQRNAAIAGLRSLSFGVGLITTSMLFLPSCVQVSESSFCLRVRWDTKNPVQTKSLSMGARMVNVLRLFRFKKEIISMIRGVVTLRHQEHADDNEDKTITTRWSKQRSLSASGCCAPSRLATRHSAMDRPRDCWR